MRLPLAALQQLARGGELVFDLTPGKGPRIFICADAEAIEQIQERVQRSLLHLLPVSDTQH